MPSRRSFFHTFILLLILAFFFTTVSLLILKKRSLSLSISNKIGVIPIEGVISDAMTITKYIEKFRKDDSIKAIIIRINSPGGSVAPTQEIYREIRKTIKKKKVIASIGGVGASGAYYIASAANKIVANPGTITGSIGVIMDFIQIRELLNKLGIKLSALKSGKFKDIGAPYREMTEEEKKLIMDMLMEVKEQFVQAVARGRHIPVEKVEKIADGRILLGSQAKRLGLVDQLGNFQDAVELAKKMAHIKGSVKLVYPRADGISFLNRLIDGAVHRLLLYTSFPILEYNFSFPTQNRLRTIMLD